MDPNLGPVLYKGDKGVNDAARPPKGGPAEAGDLSASSLPWNITPPVVTPCRWSAQADDPFVGFGEKLDKEFGLEISDETGSGGRKGMSERSQKGSWRRETLRGSRQRTAEETSRREIESRGSDEDRQDEFAVLSRQRSAERKTVKDELAFLVACRSFAQIHASVSLQMHRICSVTKLPFLHFEFTQAHIVRLSFVLFLPLPRLYFLWP